MEHSEEAAERSKLSKSSHTHGCRQTQIYEHVQLYFKNPKGSWPLLPFCLLLCSINICSEVTSKYTLFVVTDFSYRISSIKCRGVYFFRGAVRCDIYSKVAFINVVILAIILLAN